jgi:hypothetical protein
MWGQGYRASTPPAARRGVTVTTAIAADMYRGVDVRGTSKTGPTTYDDAEAADLRAGRRHVHARPGHPAITGHPATGVDPIDGEPAAIRLADNPFYLAGRAR